MNVTDYILCYFSDLDACTLLGLFSDIDVYIYLFHHVRRVHHDHHAWIEQPNRSLLDRSISRSARKY